MIQTMRALSIAISLATAATAAGYLLAGKWVGVFLALLWGSMWVFGFLRQASQNGTDEPAGNRLPSHPEIPAGAASSALLGFVLLVIAGIWSGVWPGWLLVGLVAALAGWDLDFFASRLRYVREEDAAVAFTQTHLRRLGWVLAISLLLGGLALILHFRLNFGWAMLVALLAVYGLARFIGLFKPARNGPVS
jgi:hypothetical protein